MHNVNDMYYGQLVSWRHPEEALGVLNPNQDCFPVYWTYLVCWYVMVMTGCQQLKSSIKNLDTAFLSTLELD